MNNKNVEPTCGKIQGKGKEGIKGMSLPDIEKLITKTVKGTNMDGEFKRYKTAIPKGASRRLRYCAFMKDKLKDEWSKYNKGKKPATSPKKGIALLPKAFQEMLAANQDEEFVFEDGAAEVGNVNNGDEREGGNYANSNNEGRIVPPQSTIYHRGSRVGNKDPLKNSKPSKRFLRRVELKLRGMKRRSEKIPVLKTQEDMIKFGLLKKPSEIVSKKRKASNLGPVNMRARVKRMSMPKGISTVATGRVIKGPSMAVAVPGTRLSAPEIRKATELANKLTDKLMKVGQNRNFLREVVRTNAPVDANRIANSLAGLEKFNRNSVRGVIREYELNRAKVFKNLGAPIAKKLVKNNRPVGSSMIIPKSIAATARGARNKKIADRTPVEKRAMKAMERFAKMKAAKKRPPKPTGMKVMETTRPINLMSNANKNNSNSNVPSVRSVRMMGSNNNSSNSNNK
jgi:hypothetical protein